MQPSQQFEAVRAAARSGAPDHYVSALLAPRRARDDLIALAAFLGETGRIPHLVSDPVLGEIRLQWWRDALSNGRAGNKSGHPVADTLVELIGRNALLIGDIERILDARSVEIDAGPSFPEVDLATYLADTDGAAFRLAAQVLAPSMSAAIQPLNAAAGEAYGLARLLALTRTPPGSTRLFDKPLSEIREHARSNYAETRRLLRAAPHGSIAAILPVALVGPYLRVFEVGGRDRDRRPPVLSPLTRATRLWLANASGRV